MSPGIFVPVWREKHPQNTTFVFRLQKKLNRVILSCLHEEDTFNTYKIYKDIYYGYTEYRKS